MYMAVLVTACFTRLTNAFSKTWENHWAAVAVWFGFYNFLPGSQVAQDHTRTGRRVADGRYASCWRPRKPDAQI